ncbi:MAG: GNAT family N-acetyltransferase, partial [Anaerovoracaceae bacterium]
SQMGIIKDLFAGIEDSMVIACLQGYMGEAYVDCLANPNYGCIISGEYSFFAGDSTASGAREMVENVFTNIEGDTSVAIYKDDTVKIDSEGRPLKDLEILSKATPWRDLILSVSVNTPKELIRYGIAQKDYDFNIERLTELMNSFPSKCEMKAFDADLYRQAMTMDWAKEFCETFASEEDYLKRGFGFGIVDQGKLISGASTMTVYDGGTETQVATHEDYRRQGLAIPCAAAFIIECSKRKMRPCWDAANLTSKHMALKLGYEYRGDYSTIELHRA